MSVLETLAPYALPPTGFLVLGLGAALLGAWRPVVSRLGVWLALAGLLVTAMPATSKTLIGGLEAGMEAASGDGAVAPGAIIVLGGDQSGRASPGAAFDVGPLSLERERTAARLARRTGLPVLVTGNALSPGAPPIAVLMARSLEADFLVAPRWVESAARDTWENAAQSAALLRADGIGSAFVVTQAWHMRRALMAFRHAGFPVLAQPSAIHATALQWHDLLPRPAAWLETSYAIHEWVGLAYYALRG